MGTWKSRGLQDSTLEDMIDHSNEVYREKKLALIQKIPTSITSITIGKNTRHITLAYFDQKNTVDYIGTVQGIPVCFDAREYAVKTFPLQNVYEHQIQFMGEFEEQGGTAFIILHFTAMDEVCYLPLAHLHRYWERMAQGRRKSITYDEIDKTFRIGRHRDVLMHYLELIQKDLEQRDHAGE